MIECTRVSFWIGHRKIKGIRYLRISDTKIAGAWCFETVWINGKLSDWNLIGVRPTQQNLNRIEAGIVVHLRNLLAQANIYPKALWEHLFH